MEMAVSKASKRSLREIMKEVIGAESSDMSPHEILKLAEQLQAKAHDQIDIGYLKTLLFPELYNADVPQPMST